MTNITPLFNLVLGSQLAKKTREILERIAKEKELMEKYNPVNDN